MASTVRGWTKLISLTQELNSNLFSYKEKGNFDAGLKVPLFLREGFRVS